MAAPESPSGIPLPSQCSSSVRIASRVALVKPSIAAISAPRSQRVRVISRPLPFSCISMAATRSARPMGDASGTAFRSAYLRLRVGRDQSVSLCSRLSARSSAPKSEQSRAALLEQPRSLSRSA